MEDYGHRQDAEITFRFGKNHTLEVAIYKLGGGTLFKEYDGEWAIELRDGNTILYSDPKWSNGNRRYNHHDAAVNFLDFALENGKIDGKYGVDVLQFVDENNFETV